MDLKKTINRFQNEIDGFEKQDITYDLKDCHHQISKETTFLKKYISEMR